MLDACDEAESGGGRRACGLTGTLGPGDERWTRLPRTPFARTRQKHSDLILRVRVQVPQLVVGRVDSVRLRPAARRHAVLHLLQDDGPVSKYRVCIQLNEEVRRPHCQ